MQWREFRIAARKVAAFGGVRAAPGRAHGNRPGYHHLRGAPCRRFRHVHIPKPFHYHSLRFRLRTRGIYTIEWFNIECNSTKLLFKKKTMEICNFFPRSENYVLHVRKVTTLWGRIAANALVTADKRQRALLSYRRWRHRPRRALWLVEVQPEVYNALSHRCCASSLLNNTSFIVM